jgi:hypothetical protein
MASASERVTVTIRVIKKEEKKDEGKKGKNG